MRWVTVGGLCWLSAWVAGAAFGAPNEAFQLSGLSAPVEVHFDAHGVPHVFAKTWTDAARATGYLHARDRLFQMDLLRRRASGQVAEVMGPDAADDDTQVRVVGLRRVSEAVWKLPDLPPEFRGELEAYAAGVNARIAELKTQGKDAWPFGFRYLDYEPNPWTPVDTLTFNRYMGLDQSGTNDDLWMTSLVERLGRQQVDELWPLDRPYEIPTVAKLADRRKVASAFGPVAPGVARSCEELLGGWGRPWREGRGGSFGSNNWAVDGSKTASGKPILANDPHLGFSIPSLWYAIHQSVAGQSVAGVSFPTGPSVVIGHNDRVAWGFTNMQADAVDYFAERLHADDPRQYYHRGELKRMQRVTEEVKIKGLPSRIVDVDLTVHGPILPGAARNFAMQWTGHQPTRDAVALWKLGRCGNLKEFLAALEDLDVPAMNIAYADVDGHIAIFPCGKLPRRKPGQGRAVVDGSSGEFDWKEYLPKSELPLAIDPDSHFVASANGRPHPFDYPHYLGWQWDPSYRTRRIHELLTRSRQLTLDTMRAIQYDHYDKSAESFLPTLLADVKEEADLNPLVRRAVAELEAWTFLCDPQTIAPTIWAEWFSQFRHAVWDDEWASRGMTPYNGSWGFSGNNRREPVLEVLEFLTREQPRSQWFDDRATSLVEARDDIARDSLRKALAELRMKLGDEIDNWTWGRLNVLHVGSMVQHPPFDREGGPVVGNDFTLNPGGDRGPVSSGASWRMLVDLANPRTSLGVYPAGQHGEDGDPLYADLIPLWARGEYLSLHAVGTPAELPAEAGVSSLTLSP